MGFCVDASTQALVYLAGGAWNPRAHGARGLSVGASHRKVRRAQLRLRRTYNDDVKDFTDDKALTMKILKIVDAVVALRRILFQGMKQMDASRAVLPHPRAHHCLAGGSRSTYSVAVASSASIVSSSAEVIGIIIFLIFAFGWAILYRRCTGETTMTAAVPDSRIRHLTIEKFIWEIRHEKPFRFTPEQIAGFTNNYLTRLGAGGFGTVFRGALPNGLAVAVKVFHPSLDQRSGQEQFMAEVGTIGWTHHVNLVRLFGFCFDDALRALVYEFMELGALDAFLLHRGRDVGFETLRSIAVGIARGIRYLHEECQQKIVHYDIMPGNVLLDATLTPKVADFGLARLVNRADTHVSVSGVRGTPGYAAPEMWMQSGVTEKCDVYSFGMLLFEIVGRRRNFDEAAPESQQWFPKLAWIKYESGGLMELMIMPGRDGEIMEANEDMQQCKDMVERMCKVAFWCVQQQPEARPPIAMVVKMLEGEMVIAAPVNPFQHLMAPPVVVNQWTTIGTSGQSGNTIWGDVISENSNEIVSL
ncbi:hypothetical protein EJB05_14597, partial [Eragrostis curvula]